MSEENGIKLKLSKLATTAVWQVLSEAKPTGFKNITRHSKIFHAVRNNACVVESKDGNETVTFQGGEVPLSETQFEYLDELVETVIQKPIDGRLSMHYSDFLEAMQATSAGNKK